MKRIKTGLLLVARTALVAGMSGNASALSFTATSLVQENNANCGKLVEGQPITGSAKFTRTFNKLKVTYKAKQLANLNTYELQFWSDTGGECQLLGSNGDFVTTAKGVGTFTAELEIPEKDDDFFVDGVSLGGPPFSNDSFIVTLPRP